MLISILQIVVSIALIAVILVQERSSGTSGLFGGGDEFYHTRRGLEKMIFYATVILIVAFIGLSLFGIIKS